jgi:putative ABC transport system permease protein
MWQDLRHGFRLLRSNPGFTLLAVVTLAIGIGANTAIFSAVTALLVRPLPVVDANRVVFGLAMREGFDPFNTAALEYVALRRSRAFSSAGVAHFRPVTLLGTGEPERVAAAAVGSGYLATLGTAPILGRTIGSGDDQPRATPVALIGYELWQRRFGAMTSVLGGTIQLDDGGSYTIVGVMPRGFDLPGGAGIWTPLGLNVEAASTDERAPRSYEFVARLAPGATLEQANADVRRIASNIEEAYPLTRRGWTYQLVTLRQQVLGDLAGRRRLALLTLEAAVGFLLLICCANVANLLLVRGVSREREMAVRLALGAAHGRLIRQLLAESALLALAGGGAGLLVAVWMTPALAMLNPIRAYSMSALLTDFSLDRRVMFFALAVSLATGFVFGLVPALKAGRASDLTTALKQREQRVSSGGSRWLGGLVALEIAVAVVLLVNGSLLVQSFVRLQRIDLGFEPERLVTVEFTPSPQKYPQQADRVVYVNRVLERARAVPGVVSAGITTNIPLQIGSTDSLFTVEGRPPAKPSEAPVTAHRLVTPEYLQTLGVRLVKGRLLDDHDREGAMRAAVVTEEFARAAWPTGDPIGRRIRRGRFEDTTFPWMTVVGVVADTREDAFNFRLNRPAWYLPYSQQTTAGFSLNLVARAGGDPRALVVALRDAVRSVDPQQAVSPGLTMTEHVADVLVTERFSALLMTTLAPIGLFLAACGLYGVIAYSATQRTGEIGLRMALGADRRDVLWLIMRQGTSMVAVGLAAGLVVARVLSLALAGMLYGVNANDGGTFATVAIVLLLVSAAACYLPALRAARVDPLLALRHE